MCVCVYIYIYIYIYIYKFENIKAFVTGVAERRGDDSKLQIIPFIPQDL